MCVSPVGKCSTPLHPEVAQFLSVRHRYLRKLTPLTAYLSTVTLTSRKVDPVLESCNRKMTIMVIFLNLRNKVEFSSRKNTISKQINTASSQLILLLHFKENTVLNLLTSTQPTDINRACLQDSGCVVAICIGMTANRPPPTVWIQSMAHRQKRNVCYDHEMLLN